MFEQRFHLFDLFAVPVYIDVGAALLAFMVYNNVRGLPPAEQGIWAVVLVASILLHELGHALVAKATRMRGVEITISSLGGLCTYKGEFTPGKQFLIAVAGPTTTFLLAGLGWACLHFSLFTTDAGIAVAWALLVVNLLLGIFNAMPLFPLDGGRATYAAASMVAGPAQARAITLTLSVVAALAASAAILYFQQPLINLVLIGFLLFNGFALLGRRPH
jgi:Zn-dependent protease